MSERADEAPAPVTEGNLNWELQYALLSLRTATKLFSEVDLERATEVPRELLVQTENDLMAVLVFFDHLFAFLGETKPAAKSGSSFASFTSLRIKTYPSQLAADITRELDAVGELREARKINTFHAMGLYFKANDALRFVKWMVKKQEYAASRSAAPGALPPRAATSAFSVPSAAPQGTGGSGRFPQLGSSAQRPVPGGFEGPSVARQGPSGGPGTPSAPRPATGSFAAPGTGPRAGGPSGSIAFPAPAPKPQLDLSPYESRPDEAGECVKGGGLCLWHATFAGPDSVGALTNDDATAAMPLKDGLVFAVADGNRNSLGARLGAIVAARSFCQLVAASLAQGTDVRRALMAALTGTQQRLTFLVRALVASGEGAPAVGLVRGSLPASNALKVLENTVSPDPKLRHVGPALASSLVAGAILPAAGTDRLETWLLRLGAGSAEWKGREGVRPVFTASRRGGPETAMMPGPGGDAALASVEAAGPVPLASGQHLVVTSEGLLRGHNKTVWDQLSETSFGFEAQMETNKALSLLKAMAKKGDIAFAQGRRLYDGNLALILISNLG